MKILTNAINIKKITVSKAVITGGNLKVLKLRAIGVFVTLSHSEKFSQKGLSNDREKTSGAPDASTWRPTALKVWSIFICTFTKTGRLCVSNKQTYYVVQKYKNVLSVYVSVLPLFNKKIQKDPNNIGKLIKEIFYIVPLGRTPRGATILKNPLSVEARVIERNNEKERNIYRHKKKTKMWVNKNKISLNEL